MGMFEDGSYSRSVVALLLPSSPCPGCRKHQKRQVTYVPEFLPTLRTDESGDVLVCQALPALELVPQRHPRAPFSRFSTASNSSRRSSSSCCSLSFISASTARK